MNKSSLLNLLLILVVAAGAFWMWNSVATPGIAPITPEALRDDDPETTEMIDEIAPGDLVGELDDPLPEGLQRMVLEQADPGNTRNLVLQVWEGRRGVPAAEADVFILDGFDGPELTDPFAQHWSTLAEERGQRFTADVRGRVELPPIRDWAIVTAQRPGSYGFAKLGPDHRDVETIILGTDETVTVLVVDGEGRPAAGVPVGVLQQVPVREDFDKSMAQWKQLEQAMADALRFLEENPGQREAVAPRIRGIRQRQAMLKGALADGKTQLQKADKKAPAAKKAQAALSKPKATIQPELRAQRRTDQDGLAVFRHFQEYRHQPEKWWTPEQADQFEAALLMPLQQPVSRAFAGRPVPDATLELRLPPTGSITLRTIDRDGRSFTQPVQAELRVQNAEPVPWARVQTGSAERMDWIEFPFVGLGLKFMVRGQLEDGDFRWEAPPFAGPNAPGERMEVDLIVAPDAGMLFGRVLDAAGEPLSGLQPTFSLASSSGQLESDEVTLDDEGRFHLPYQVREEHRAPFRFEVRRDDVHPTAGLAMKLPQLPERHVTDLGDLRIEALGQITQGTVVDDRGEPISGVMVQLQSEREIIAKRPRLEFVDEAFVATRTDHEGNYELFGELELGRYRLRTESQGHFPYQFPDVRRGDRADLELLRNSKVVGTALVPDWMPRGSVQVHLESVGDPRPRRQDRLLGKGAETYLFFDWVEPGVYNLTLTVQDFPDPFLRVDGFEITPGQQGIHPRLQDLNLGAFLFQFDVAAVDERGQPIQPEGPLLARVVRPGGRAGFVGFKFGKGNRVQILNTTSQLEVRPFSPGYRADATVLGPGRSDVRYLTIPPVELQLPGFGELVGTARVTLSVEMVGNSSLPGDLETWDQRSGRFAQWYRDSRSLSAQLRGDAVRMQLMLDGRYRVTAGLASRVKRVRPVPVDLGEIEVSLVPGSGPLEVKVNFDPQAVQAAAAELARREAGNE